MMQPMTPGHDLYSSVKQPAVNKVFEKTKEEQSGYHKQKNNGHIEIITAQTHKDQGDAQRDINGKFTPVISAGFGHIQDEIQHSIEHKPDLCLITYF